MTIIKICGLTQPQDVAAALDLDADWLGFIHVPKSPRFVPIENLEGLLAMVPKGRHRVVVVRDASPQQLDLLRARLSFEDFQFHGGEPATHLARWGGYKALPVSAEPPASDILLTLGSPILLDTAVNGQSGGTGCSFDWSWLPRLQGRFIVAGGLAAGNVSELVARYRPWDVDVSSGIEKRPGHKDHALMARFIEEVRRQE